MREAVIVEAVRTPIGKRNGLLRGYHPIELGAIVLREVLARTGLQAHQVDQVIMGCVSQVGEQGANVARHALLQAGFPVTIPGMTVDFQCGSSQQAVHLAASLIQTGVADVIIAGGVESMSRVPMASNFVNGPGSPFTPEIMERYDIIPQGLSAEVIAQHWNIGRRELDEIGFRSHTLAARATEAGWFEREIVPLPATLENGSVVTVDRDEGIRYNPSLEKMATLKTPFKEDGVVTAGNSSQISDGAAALLVMGQDVAQALDLTPRARIVAQYVVGVDPHTMLTGPIPATREILNRAGLTLENIDLIEINEAFASVVAAWQRELQPDMARVNVQGGAIALGHPLGATGAKLMVSLIHALERTGGRLGLQTMCCGGGLGTATILERVSASI
ncbi:MAG TPA: thiolase family protein [Anaerolineae bacterium]|nr:thiolase family protein [Anaerolineae bacterium]